MNQTADQRREAFLFGRLAAVIETGGYNYGETMRTLERLTEYYKANVGLYLAETKMQSIVQEVRSAMEQKQA